MEPDKRRCLRKTLLDSLQDDTKSLENTLRFRVSVEGRFEGRLAHPSKPCVYEKLKFTFCREEGCRRQLHLQYSERSQHLRR